jgi:hypothetical protein
MKLPIEYISVNYPKVGKALDMFWGYKEFRPYVNSLLADTRGTRQGFPAPILILLIELLEQHDREFPEFIPDEPPYTFY